MILRDYLPRPTLKGPSPLVRSASVAFRGVCVVSIEVPSSVDEFIQGEKEPASSGVVVVLGFVSMLSFLILYGILFPGRDMPVISEVLPMFEGVFDSGIWFFLMGVIFGAFSIIATMLTEATSE